jgi:hypothetical protein
VSIEGLIVAFIMLIVVALIAVVPLLGRRTRRGDLSLSSPEQLVVQYERVLKNVRDLDEDFATGKMPQTDYALEREEWVQRGIHLLKLLDDTEILHTVRQRSHKKKTAS